MRITLIAAVASNRVIGRDGDIPWHLPADLGRFMRTTMGHTLLMGRRTLASTGPLRGRTTLVLTRDPEYRPPPTEGAATRVEVVGSLDEGVARARELGEEELFVCGGEGLYREALARPGLVDRLDLTRVDAEPEGDTFFPEIDWSRWRRVAREEHRRDDRHPYAYSFEVWERTTPPCPA